LEVNAATKVPFISRRHPHFVTNTRLSIPGKGILMEFTMNMLWLFGSSICIFGSLPFFFSKAMLPAYEQCHM
jgi:hypothetical protein